MGTSVILAVVALVAVIGISVGVSLFLKRKKEKSKGPHEPIKFKVSPSPTFEKDVNSVIEDVKETTEAVTPDLKEIHRKEVLQSLKDTNPNLGVYIYSIKKLEGSNPLKLETDDEVRQRVKGITELRDFIGLINSDLPEDEFENNRPLKPEEWQELGDKYGNEGYEARVSYETGTLFLHNSDFMEDEKNADIFYKEFYIDKNDEELDKKLGEEYYNLLGHYFHTKVL